MKRGHLQRRPPRGRQGFAWGRVVIPDGQGGGVEYRLFLRDSTGATFGNFRRFGAFDLERDARARIARELPAMRRQLRWAVDQVEFQRLGLQDTAPDPRAPNPAAEMHRLGHEDRHVPVDHVPDRCTCAGRTPRCEYCYGAAG